MNRFSAASALALLATMALHPTGHDVLRSGGGKAAVSHSIALISVPLALYGFLILTRRLGGLALLAFITWAAGAMAVINAAVLSGFVAPAFIDDPTRIYRAIRLAAQNTGNAHVQVSDFELGLPAAGEPIARESTLAYVLAGQRRLWTLPAPPDRVKSVSEFRLRAYTDAGEIDTAVKVER